jgi:hypothetical protein
VTGDQPEDTLEVPAGLESRIGDILHRKGVAEVILNVGDGPADSSIVVHHRYSMLWDEGFD